MQAAGDRAANQYVGAQRLHNTPAPTDPSPDPSLLPSRSHDAGLEQHEAGAPEAALTCFSKAIFLEPDNAAHYKTRAEVYLTMCDFKSATSNFRKAVMLDNEDVSVRVSLARVLGAVGLARLLAGEHEAAVGILSEAIALDGFTASPFAHRALARVALQQWTAALEDAQCALRVEAHSVDLLVLRGKLFWKLGRQREGNEDFKRAHELAPGHPEVRAFEQMMWEQAEQAYQGASGCLLQGDYEQAIELLTSALELNPGDVKVLVLRASAKRQARAFDGALEDLAEAKEIYCYNQAQAQKEEAQKGSAAAAAADVAAAADDDMEVYEHPEITRQRNLTWNDMAVGFFKQADFEGALTLFNQLIKSEREVASLYEGSAVDARFFVNRGDCYRAMGQAHLEAALEDYRKAHDLLPGNADVRTRMALVSHAKGTHLFNLGRFQDADVEFSSAIKHNPNVATFFVHRGNALYFQQKYDRAYQEYQHALRLDPQNKEAQQRVLQFRSAKTRDTSKPAPARDSGEWALAGATMLSTELRAAGDRAKDSDAVAKQAFAGRADLKRREISDFKRKEAKEKPWNEVDHLQPPKPSGRFGEGPT